MKKRKKLIAIITTLAIGATFLVGCESSTIDTEDTPKQVITEKEEKEDKKDKEETPIKLEEIELVGSYFELDSIGTIYFNSQLKNNSKYNIKYISYTYEIDNAERSYLMCSDGIPVGGTSSLCECFGVTSQNFEDMKLIDMQITYLDENNEEHYIEYNNNLKTYSWF